MFREDETAVATDLDRLSKKGLTWIVGVVMTGFLFEGYIYLLTKSADTKEVIICAAYM